MKHDISSRHDIIQMVNTFYDKVKRDDLIAHFFTTVVPVDWEKHLPVMYKFWESVILHTGEYSGNPMISHKMVHKKQAVETHHFQRWLKLFTETVDDLFEGENAETAKQRAISIATVMQIKMHEYGSGVA